MERHHLRTLVALAACAACAVSLSLAATRAATAQDHVQVFVAPPAARLELRGSAPTPNHVWIDGYWRWNGASHDWVPGHWELAPQAGMRWRPARWVQQGNGWRFENGNWIGGSSNPPTTVTQVPGGTVIGQNTIVRLAPPRARIETRPPAPGPGYMWIEGYWQWNGQRHDWISGRWERPMNPSATYVQPRWQRSGHGWRFVPGQWRERRGIQNAPPYEEDRRARRRRPDFREDNNYFHRRH